MGINVDHQLDLYIKLHVPELQWFILFLSLRTLLFRVFETEVYVDNRKQ